MRSCSGRAAASLANVQLKRVQTLIDAHATSQEELDNARATAEQARADLQAADAAVADAKLNLGFTEVRAPIAGRVGRAVATVGNLARADDTLLTTVVSQNPVYVYFDCDEQSYLRYNARRADPKHRAIGADPVRVGLANETGFPHAGTVDFLDNRLDPQRARSARACGCRMRTIRLRRACMRACSSSAAATRMRCSSTTRPCSPGSQVRVCDRPATRRCAAT